MRWADVLAEPSLKNLPFKIELNEKGHIEMSPASNFHGYLQSELVWLLRSQLDTGRVITECSIDTPKGVKVADVAWGSSAFVAEQGDLTPFTKAPEICIEIVSPSNTFLEMQDKVLLYLAKGAKEVWLVKERGTTAIYRSEGEVTESLFVSRTAV
ncbi:MAG: Uma2 family endonuclease [Thiotrichales bacterium]